MRSLEKNPPAFPVEIGFGLEPGEASQTGEHLAQFPGMTLRDYFAGQALAAMGTWMPYGFGNLDSDAARDVRSRWAYAQADAMLAERSKA